VLEIRLLRQAAESRVEESGERPEHRSGEGAEETASRFSARHAADLTAAQAPRSCVRAERRSGTHGAAMPLPEQPVREHEGNHPKAEAKGLPRIAGYG